MIAERYVVQDCCDYVLLLLVVLLGFGVRLRLYSVRRIVPLVFPEGVCLVFL